MKRTLFVALALATVLCACGGKKNPQAKAPAKPVTERQRDSAIGASGLPGAKGIIKALHESDSIRAQNARLDSIH
jgi:hypothetical protein